jgi:hypothetical protein
VAIELMNAEMFTFQRKHKHKKSQHISPLFWQQEHTSAKTGCAVLLV